MTLIIITTALMLAAALTACAKPGAKDSLTDYGYIEK
jgi:hypothetical protein